MITWISCSVRMWLWFALQLGTSRPVASKISLVVCQSVSFGYFSERMKFLSTVASECYFRLIMNCSEMTHGATFGR